MTITIDNLPGKWVRKAACSIDSAEEFFRGTAVTNPVATEPSSDYAKAICKRCDVREQCLAWVLADDERRIAKKESVNDGVWGGTTRRERWQMRRQA